MLSKWKCSLLLNFFHLNQIEYREIRPSLVLKTERSRRVGQSLGLVPPWYGALPVWICKFAAFLSCSAFAGLGHHLKMFKITIFEFANIYTDNSNSSNIFFVVVLFGWVSLQLTLWVCVPVSVSGEGTCRWSGQVAGQGLCLTAFVWPPSHGNHFLCHRRQR